MSTDFEIREALRKLRSRLAYMEGNKHAYSFSDAELESIVDKKPCNIDELTSLKGFPKNGKRVQAYGSIIVDIVNGKRRPREVEEMFKNITLEKSSAFSR